MAAGSTNDFDLIVLGAGTGGYTAAFRAAQLGMNVALVGRNLWTKTDFPNYDPENSTNAGNGGQGFDMGAMPTTRNFGFNFSITP